MDNNSQSHVSAGNSNYTLFFFFLNLFEDVGGGWLEGRNSKGERGLVPTDYVEVRIYSCLLIKPGLCHMRFYELST